MKNDKQKTITSSWLRRRRRFSPDSLGLFAGGGKQNPPIIVKISRELWENIKSKLFDANEGQDITLAELLKELDVSVRENIPAIQSSLNWATVFHKKRSPDE